MADDFTVVVPKNTREELHVSLTTFSGYNLINLRVFFQAGDGSMRPGKAGLSMRIDRLGELIEALKKAEVEARRLGQIDG